MVVAVLQSSSSSAAVISGLKVTENAHITSRKSFPFRFATACPSSSSSSSRFVVVRTASKSPNQQPNSQDDLYFLLKLGAGSFAGAAAIKYGSILVPEITRPSITQALIMIFTPVLVSVLVLIKQSRVEQQ